MQTIDLTAPSASLTALQLAAARLEGRSAEIRSELDRIKADLAGGRALDLDVVKAQLDALELRSATLARDIDEHGRAQAAALQQLRH